MEPEAKDFRTHPRGRLAGLLLVGLAAAALIGFGVEGFILGRWPGLLLVEALLVPLFVAPLGALGAWFLSLAAAVSYRPTQWLSPLLPAGSPPWALIRGPVPAGFLPVPLALFVGACSRVRRWGAAGRIPPFTTTSWPAAASTRRSVPSPKRTLSTKTRRRAR